MAAKMETLDPATLPDVTSAASYQCRPDTVTFSSGVVSVAGITVVTGGVELSCRSCILAFGFWGTLIGLSCLAVAIWDQLGRFQKENSTLLGLGLVILVLSFSMVAIILVFHLLTKRKRGIRREEGREGKQVLVQEGPVIKKVTV